MYSYDVGLLRKVQPGDSFDVLYRTTRTARAEAEVRYAGSPSAANQAIQPLPTTDDGVYDYYDEDGKSREEIPGCASPCRSAW